MFCDYHTHSTYSDDADNTMTEMALAAAGKGLDVLCFTDHVDLDDINGVYNPAAWREEEYFSAFSGAVERTEGRIALRLGVELGEASHYPEAARAVAARIPDFIIGSVHNLSGTPDFYCGRPGGELPDLYADDAACHALLEQYVAELEDTIRLDAFDVLGHIGYPLRYMRLKYPSLGLEPWRDRFAALFRLLAETGRGLEVNTSGLRGTLGETMPAPWLLRLYREQGGEILTLGSDAHRTADVGAGIQETKKMLLALGFKRYCVYNKRKPEFIALDER